MRDPDERPSEPASADEGEVAGLYVGLVVALVLQILAFAWLTEWAS
ncbi:MAG: hypothetical protein HC923_03685 [Myxococcales bacterium]|nr:hypothetical protein [Myxococcales bacterium]